MESANWSGSVTTQDLANVLVFMERSLAVPFKNQAEVETYQTLRNKVIAGINAMATVETPPAPSPA